MVTDASCAVAFVCLQDVRWHALFECLAESRIGAVRYSEYCRIRDWLRSLTLLQFYNVFDDDEHIAAVHKLSEFGSTLPHVVTDHNVATDTLNTESNETRRSRNAPTSTSTYLHCLDCLEDARRQTVTINDYVFNSKRSMPHLYCVASTSDEQNSIPDDKRTICITYERLITLPGGS